MMMILILKNYNNGDIGRKPSYLSSKTGGGRGRGKANTVICLWDTKNKGRASEKIA